MQHDQMPSFIRLRKVLSRFKAGMAYLHNLVGNGNIAAYRGIGKPNATLDVIHGLAVSLR